jgi:histidinol-phosphate aminotransferase
VSGPSEGIALEALADPEAARAMRAEVLAQRRRIARALEGIGCEVLPSVANFVAFRPPDAAALADALDARGLVLRRYDAGPMQGWLRVTARPAAETDRLIAALEGMRQGGRS